MKRGYWIQYSVAILVALILSFHFVHGTPIIAYVAILITSSIVYLLVCREALRSTLSLRKLIPLIVLCMLVRLTFVGTHPIGSDDFFRYVWDGKVQASGINPYRYAPEDPKLTFLHTAQIPRLVNHPDMRTLYFPLSEWAFYLSYILSGEQTWGFQFLIFIAEIATVVGLTLLLRELGLSPWYVLLYVANPLIIFQFAVDAHVDVLGFPFLVFGILFYVRKRLRLSLVLIGLSLLIKPTALVLLPIFFLDQKGLLNRIEALLVPLVVMLIPFIPYSLGVNPFRALATFSENWYFNGALFSLLLPIFPDNQSNRLWCLAILMALLGMLYLSRKHLREKLVMSLLFLLLCSPVAHPWYMGWMIVLLPIAPLLSGITLAATASLPSITFVMYQLHGIWKDYPAVLLLEYVPVVVLLYLDLRRGLTASTESLRREER